MKLTITPNPLPWHSSSTVIAWQAEDTVAELCVVAGAEPEKTVARGSEGRLSIDWIRRGVSYEFRLYRSSPERQLLCAARAEREAIPWHDLDREVSLDAIAPEEELAAAEFLGNVAQRLVSSASYQKLFRLWEKENVHITPVHFYEPIPDTRSIALTCWNEREMRGVDLRLKFQLHLIEKVFPRYAKEYDSFPLQPKNGDPFYLENGIFAGLDSLVTYCMVRHFQPRRIIEVGGGYSSLILARAALRNGNTSLTTIEPFPSEFLRQSSAGVTELIETKVEALPLDFFDSLGSNDILFIDSSHVIKIGGDVNYLFLEVLPRLARGVIVHVHDINFPFDYPRKWVLDLFRFWTEQYLLEAFLTFNSEFEVLLSNSLLFRFHPARLHKTYPTLRMINGGSFWMRRKVSAWRKLFRSWPR